MHFGREIGAEEARAKGLALVQLLRVSLKPMRKSEFQALEEKYPLKKNV